MTSDIEFTVLIFHSPLTPAVLTVSVWVDTLTLTLTMAGTTTALDFPSTDARTLYRQLITTYTAGGWRMVRPPSEVTS